MIVINSEQRIDSDIDETLLMWNEKTNSTVQFRNPYTGGLVDVSVNSANLEVLKGRLARGATVVLHSASGYKWAAAAAVALGLDNNPNIIVMSKPVAYIDDKPCEKWMGDHIYLKPDDRYGRGS